MADNKSTYSSLMNELVDTINEKANSSDSKNLEELVATAKTIVKPEGTLEITENKQYDVSGYAFANVNVASSGEGEVRSLKQLFDMTKNANAMFYNTVDYAYNNLTDLTNIFEYSDTENVTDMGDMFHGCKGLVKIPLLNTSNVTKMNAMFQYCDNSGFTEIPQFDTSKVVFMQFMFQGCAYLIKIPLLNTSNVTNMNQMCSGCYRLTEIQLSDTSNVTSMTSIFSNCQALTSITLNMIKVTSNSNANNMLYRTLKLTNLVLTNIKVNLTIGSGDGTGNYDYGHLLTIESLLNTCQECIKQSSARTLTVGTANLEKLSSIYVKLTDTTNTTKYPMVQCENTDEGAMLVADYMALKNWSLA